MKFKFYNLGGREIAQCEADDSRAAIVWLFSAWDQPPPANAITFLGTLNGRQRVSVGPFDLLLEAQP